MDKQLLGGIAWTAAAKWSSQILTWTCLLVVARLVTPADFGIVGMAGVYLGLVTAFSEFGFGSAVVTLRNLSADEIAQINTFSVISGVVGFILSCALAEPLGWFFRSPQLPAVVVVMSSAFLVSGFKTVPTSLLQKELKFKQLSVIDTIATVTQSLCVLLLAWTGLGYWALVLGNVLGAALSTVLNVALRPSRFARPRLHSIGHAINFSWQVLVGRMSFRAYADADLLVAGRILGATPLGAYTFAWNLATLPVDKITALVGQVTPAFFSASQSDHSGLRRYLRALTEGLSLLTFPATFGLAMTASELVPLVLGKTWSAVTAPLEILAFYASFRSISTFLGPLLTAVRETRFLMWNNLAALIVMPTAFYIGSRWGPSGIAWGWLLGYPFIAVPLYVRVFRKIGMSTRVYLDALRPALTGSLALIVMVSVVKWAMPQNWSLSLRFVVEVITGAGAFLAVLSVFHRDRVRSFMSLYRRIRATRGTAAAT